MAFDNGFDTRDPARSSSHALRVPGVVNLVNATLPFLLEVMRLPQRPVEEWWTWRGSQVHLDRFDAEDAPLKVIVLHGGGGTGRLVGAFGTLVDSLGYSYVAPDLPGFGLTVPSSDYDPQYRSLIVYEPPIRTLCSQVDDVESPILAASETASVINTA